MAIEQNVTFANTFDQGVITTQGWWPVFAAVRRASDMAVVLRIADWNGGFGDKPTTGYLSAQGIVQSVEHATQFHVQDNDLGDATAAINRLVQSWALNGQTGPDIGDLAQALQDAINGAAQASGFSFTDSGMTATDTRGRQHNVDAEPLIGGAVRPFARYGNDDAAQNAQQAARVLGGLTQAVTQPTPNQLHIVGYGSDGGRVSTTFQFQQGGSPSASHTVAEIRNIAGALLATSPVFTYDATTGTAIYTKPLPDDGTIALSMLTSAFQAVIADKLDADQVNALIGNHESLAEVTRFMTALRASREAARGSWTQGIGLAYTRTDAVLPAAEGADILTISFDDDQGNSRRVTQDYATFLSERQGGVGQATAQNGWGTGGDPGFFARVDGNRRLYVAYDGSAPCTFNVNISSISVSKAQLGLDVLAELHTNDQLRALIDAEYHKLTPAPNQIGRGDFTAGALTGGRRGDVGTTAAGIRFTYRGRDYTLTVASQGSSELAFEATRNPQWNDEGLVNELNGVKLVLTAGSREPVTLNLSSVEIEVVDQTASWEFLGTYFAAGDDVTITVTGTTVTGNFVVDTDAFRALLAGIMNKASADSQRIDYLTALKNKPHVESTTTPSGATLPTTGLADGYTFELTASQANVDRWAIMRPAEDDNRDVWGYDANTGALTPTLAGATGILWGGPTASTAIRGRIAVTRVSTGQAITKLEIARLTGGQIVVTDYTLTQASSQLPHIFRSPAVANPFAGGEVIGVRLTYADASIEPTRATLADGFVELRVVNWVHTLRNLTQQEVRNQVAAFLADWVYANNQFVGATWAADRRSHRSRPNTFTANLSLPDSGAGLLQVSARWQTGTGLAGVTNAPATALISFDHIRALTADNESTGTPGIRVLETTISGNRYWLDIARSSDDQIYAVIGVTNGGSANNVATVQAALNVMRVA